jgi:transposase
MTDRGKPIIPGRDIAPVWRDQRIAELEAELAQARAENGALKVQIVELEQRLAEWERVGKRQATPFARAKHTADPKQPGRKAGQGLFSYRTPPTPDEVDQTKEARLERCPECGGMVTDVKAPEHFVIDPPEIEPTITRYVTESGYCSRCGRRVHSRHPEQISAAKGCYVRP